MENSCSAYFELETKKYPCGLYLIELEKIIKIKDIIDFGFSEFAKPKYLSKAPALIRQDLTDLLNAWENGMNAWFMQHRTKCPVLKGHYLDEVLLDEKLPKDEEV